MPTEPEHDPVFRTLDLGAEAKKAWGAKWNASETSYRFGDREFVLRTGDSNVYAGHHPGNPILQEDSLLEILQEDGHLLLME
jgi:hypothetical protein